MKGCREVLARLCAEVLPAAKGRVRHLGARRHTDAVKRHGSPKNRPPRNPVDTPHPRRPASPGRRFLPCARGKRPYANGKTKSNGKGVPVREIFQNVRKSLVKSMICRGSAGFPVFIRAGPRRLRG